MANYESALTGQQMDAALTDVALRNSEAWAVGTRNGRNVTSADETYHNNAKYYAQVAQSAIPGTYTAAVRWDIAQGLAGEAQEQARANISAGSSNRNLLDNPWWGSGEVVNQRSFTSGQTTNNAYCIDRWKTSYGSTVGTISLGADGLTITAASGTYALINQVIERYSALSGKTVTASALLSNGTIVSGTVANLNWANVPIVVTSGNVRLQLLSGGYFRVTILNGGSATIRAVKLELGSYSTLANDVPPDYGEELRKCKYYFERVKTAGNTLSLGIGYNDGYNTMYGVMKIEPKRVTPSLSGSSLLIGTTSLNTTSSSKSIYSFGSDGTAVIQIVATNAFSTNQPYRFGIPANGYIDFSADI